MSNNKPYYSSLNLLRIVAVLAVISSHTSFGNPYNMASMGVLLFFSMSGYLITDILLHQKNNITNFKDTLHSYKVFFSRRALRIFPIYYLTLFLVKLFFADSFSWETLGTWYYTYLANFHFLFVLEKFPGMYSHLWTLSVEEQFYLIWPWIIFLTPYKYLKHIILIFIASGPVSRLSFSLFYEGDPKLATKLFTVCNFDIIGLGALMALKGKSVLASDFKSKKIIYSISSFCFVLYLISFKNDWPYYLVWTNSLLCISFFGLVLFFLRNDKKIAIPILSPLIYLGKISYGIYLYHSFVLALVVKVYQKLSKYGTFSYPKSYVVFLLVSLISIVIAHFSWILLEKHILKLKVPYKEKSHK